MVYAEGFFVTFRTTLFSFGRHLDRKIKKPHIFEVRKKFVR